MSPILTDKELERQAQQRFKERVREIELRKFANPDRDPDLEGVWAAHVWVQDGDTPDKGEWVFAGFRRRRKRRKPQTMGRFFAKVRRQLNIHKKAPVMLMDLGMTRQRILSTDQAWRLRPPQFQKRKPKMEQRMPSVNRKKHRTRAKQKAYLLNKRTTKYIMLGRNPWDRASGYLYLGPLKSEKKRQAQFEAKRMFGMYKELLVIGTNELSKPLRQAMARGRKMRAGVSRVQWPEVPPTFDVMWAKFLKRLLKKDFHGAISAEDTRLIDVEMALRAEWEAQGQPWLSTSWFRKQIKPWRPDTCVKKKARKAKRRVSKKAIRSKTTSRTRSTRKRKPRSIGSRGASGTNSARATRTKVGRTKTGSRKRPTNGQSVRGSSSRSVKRIRAVLKRRVVRTVRAKLRKLSR